MILLALFAASERSLVASPRTGATAALRMHAAERRRVGNVFMVSRWTLRVMVGVSPSMRDAHSNKSSHSSMTLRLATRCQSDTNAAPAALCSRARLQTVRGTRLTFLEGVSAFLGCAR